MQHEFVTVATYPQAVEAHAARNFLEQNRIQAFVADEYFSALKYATLCTVKLQVPAADVDRARALLDAAAGG
jgi:hypothetical protein